MSVAPAPLEDDVLIPEVPLAVPLELPVVEPAELLLVPAGDPVEPVLPIAELLLLEPVA